MKCYVIGRYSSRQVKWKIKMTVTYLSVNVTLNKQTVISDVVLSAVSQLIFLETMFALHRSKVMMKLAE